MTKVLIATVKPFAPAAVKEIKAVLDKANYDYTFLVRMN